MADVFDNGRKIVIKKPELNEEFYDIFSDRNYRFAANTELDAEMRNASEGTNYPHYIKKPYVNTIDYIYSEGKKNASSIMKTTINDLDTDQNTIGNKIYLDVDLIKGILNDTDIEKLNVVLEKIDWHTDSISGIFTSASLINNISTMMNNSDSGIYYLQSHEPKITTNSTEPFKSSAISYNALDLTEFVNSYKNKEGLALNRNDYIKVAIDDKKTDSNSFSGEANSFNSGLYDGDYASKIWMGAKSVKLTVSNPKITISDTGITLIDGKILLPSNLDLDRSGYPVINYYHNADIITIPVLYMMFNDIPIRMKCNKVSDKTHIYTWPEYLVNIYEVINGLDYILVDGGYNHYNGSFYVGNTSNYLRDNQQQYELNIRPLNTVNYVDSEVEKKV